MQLKNAWMKKEISSQNCRQKLTEKHIETWISVCNHRSFRIDRNVSTAREPSSWAPPPIAQHHGHQRTGNEWCDCAQNLKGKKTTWQIWWNCCCTQYYNTIVWLLVPQATGMLGNHVRITLTPRFTDGKPWHMSILWPLQIWDANSNQTCFCTNDLRASSSFISNIRSTFTGKENQWNAKI